MTTEYRVTPLALETRKQTQLWKEYTKPLVTPYNSISVRNPQANAIMERIHQTVGNIIHKFFIQQTNLDNDNL